METIELEDAALLPTYSKLPIVLVRGEGSYVWDSVGNRYLDFYGGHCVTALGHCPPRVVNAIRDQTGRLLFYSNVVYSPIRAKAASLLAQLAPEGMKNIYFCNSGTEANETALKLARTWTGKSGIIAMKDGFHGRTLGSLAATGIDKYREPYSDILPHAHFATFGDADSVNAIVQTHDDIGALILEPIQSMAGVRVAHDGYFKRLRSLCDEYGCALIFDEVQTGVGRTGSFSFAEAVSVTPDIITMAKSLASGVPVGAVFASDAIAESVQPGDHGTTFGGGMIAMAAVAATIEELTVGGWMARAQEIFEQVRSALEAHVAQVRGRGCLIGVELDHPVAPVLAALRERGILAGSSGDTKTLRLMPPLNASDAEVSQFAEAFIAVLSEVSVAANA